MQKVTRKLFNPTHEDFIITYDSNGDGNPLSYILHAGEIESFDKQVALHIRKHLAQKMSYDLKGRGTQEDALKKAFALIDVKGEEYGE